MGQDLGLDGLAGVFPLSDRFAEIGDIPVIDAGGEQVEPGHAVMLALAGLVAHFALASDLDGVVCHPLFRSVLARRCISASSSQSRMKSVRSTCPILRRVTVSSC